ncbi:BlaI/MecI/CopY family transcriptional regulator [Kutzneria buriramensis]|uniref:Putative transcriptional regulator n=1 Tax=Kutzneria buriramensis TaxID=1045776 RepID=A0A3E0GW71_9PSEU|nr:BlaI/MecI/CopY family transcriptional regulator [Kutzneria buriramensis]REH27685.1 putative transcriptional regulator [Kutzneria buriramensis]
MPRRSRGGLEREIHAVLAAGDGPMTAGQVRDALGGDLAYTTVLTVLSRLFDKGEIAREQAGRGYAYSAPYDAAALTARRMTLLLDDRDADRAAVLTRFVDGLGPGDEQLLRGLLDR